MTPSAPSPLWKRIGKRVLYSGLPIPGFLRPLIRGIYRLGVFVVESSSFLFKLLVVEPILRSVCRTVGVGLRAERIPFMRGRGRLSMADHVNLSGRSCFYFISNRSPEPEIVIGSHVFIGNGCTLSSGSKIEIGDHCLLAAGVRIHDNDGHPLDPQRRREGAPVDDTEIAPVIIGSNVWLGADATVLKGVSIGENAVIGTGAVVTSDVPPNSICAGNPARVVRELR